MVVNDPRRHWTVSEFGGSLVSLVGNPLKFNLPIASPHVFHVIKGAAPAFDSASYSGSVNENVATDTTVSGITISATDSDGDSITYSIISSAGPFKLNGAGIKVLTNGQSIDYEAQNSYSLTVQAEANGES